MKSAVILLHVQQQIAFLHVLCIMKIKFNKLPIYVKQQQYFDSNDVETLRHNTNTDTNTYCTLVQT